MDRSEYEKELRSLYEQAKDRGRLDMAHVLLEKLRAMDVSLDVKENEDAG